MQTDLMASLHANLTPPAAAPAVPAPPAVEPEPNLPPHLLAWVNEQPAEHREEALRRAVQSLTPAPTIEAAPLDPTPTSATPPEPEPPSPKRRGRPRKAVVDTSAMGVLLACAAAGQSVASTREFLELAKELSQ